MEKFTPQESVPEYDPEIEPSESLEQPEGLESGLRNAWQKTSRQVTRWMQIAVATSLIGAAVEKAEAGDVRIVSKGSGQARVFGSESAQETDRKMRSVEEICRKNGFFVSLRGSAAQITLPPGEVKKIILHIGQIHGAAPYSETDEEQRRFTAVEQREIQNLLEGAAEASRETPVCLLEGVLESGDADSYKIDSRTLEAYARFGYAIAQSNDDVEKVVMNEIETFRDYARSLDADERTKLTAFNNILSEMAYHAGKCINDDGLTRAEKARAGKAVRILQEHANEDVLLYELGGTVMASRHGKAELAPAETVERSHLIFSKVCSDMGVKYDRNMDFYSFMSKQSPRDQKRMGDLIAKYATEKDVERGPIDQAEKSLAGEDLVVVVFGEGHDLSDVMADKYLEGKMKDTALVKINTTDFQLKMAGK